MITQQCRRRIFLVRTACTLALCSQVTAVSAEPIEISWRTATKIIAEDGVTVTREGNAEFATGERAHIVNKGVAGPGISWSRGTASVESIYRFDDGSGFTLRYAQVWDAIRNRAVGLFCDGAGRFTGISGEATGNGETPGGPLLWTGKYELPEKP